MKSKFDQLKDLKSMCFGYIHPGHGWKGKQQWIEDVDELYSVHTTNPKKTKDILLWCYLDSTEKKRKTTSSEQPANKRTKCLQNNENKTSEAKSVFDELQQKHAEKYTPEQLHAWAQLVQMKKYVSMEEPPDYPFFKNKSRKDRDLPILPSNTTSQGLSPGRRIHMRTECIEQLQKIGKLLDIWIPM